MDEDEYIGKVEKIIERDFFPELEKLKAQSDYIDARERKDYETMSRLEEKYSGVRPDTGKRLQSPATFETPLDEPRESDPRRPDKDPKSNTDAASDTSAAASGAQSDKEKIILHGNTRISKTPWRSEKQMDKLRREVEHKEALAAGRVGIDGKELVRPETPSVNGFKLMSMTPSPALGVEDSPLMTWGEVDTTPYMLGGCDTPLVTSGGAGGGFQIQETSARDRIAHQLAENNSRYYRERKMKAMQQVKSSLKAGKGLANMSPAAQRLASGKLGIRVGTDSMLKASYTPSPARKTPGSTPTPRSTPSRTPSSKSKVTPKLGVRTKTPGTGKTSSDITDNLLDINLSKSNDKVKVNTDNLLQISSSSRPRASDFFKKQ